MTTHLITLTSHDRGIAQHALQEWQADWTRFAVRSRDPKHAANCAGHAMALGRVLYALKHPVRT